MNINKVTAGMFSIVSWLKVDKRRYQVLISYNDKADKTYLLSGKEWVAVQRAEHQAFQQALQVQP